MTQKNTPIISKIFGYAGFYILNRIDLRLLYSPLGATIENWRQSCLRLIGATIDEGSFLRADGRIYFPQNLYIGENSKIGTGYKLFLFENLQIGDDVEIGPDVLIYTGEHHFDNPDLPLTKQGAYHEPVIIGDDVYIGARVTILKGTVIHNRVIIAAGAVVHGELESGYIYGGVPAKKIKSLPSQKIEKAIT